jgi:DNA-binding MarR family transcriptional regulator
MSTPRGLKLVKPQPAPPERSGPQPPEVQRDVVTRWGGNPRLFTKGYVPVPVVFLERGASLKPFSLSPAEMLFVISLMAHKWDSRAPFPGYRRLATWMGVSESYVRKIARSLEGKRFLQRRRRVGTTNEFDLTPLFQAFAEATREEQ